MGIAKQAVAYYCMKTGKEWSTFFDRIDEAMSISYEDADDEIWLIKKLLELIIKSISIEELKANKDDIKSSFDNEGRKNAGEFFTPLIWCKEARKYFDKYIPNWHDYLVWDVSCGTGNLMNGSGHPAEKIFLSTLEETDLNTVRSIECYNGATIFQLDFLTGIDYDEYNTDFLDRLPEYLRNAILNDEKIIFFANPPYKSGVARATEVGRYMCTIGLNKSAYDLFYQFCWRIMNFVEMFNLHNTYYCFFGPVTFFTGSSANALLREFQQRFQFIDGMSIAASDFSGTSQDIKWAIGCSLWKSLGTMESEREVEKILLETKMFDMDGNITTGERTLYTAPRQRLSDWCEPKDVIYYREAPIATSHLTFKGSDEGVLVSNHKGKIAENALGTMMVDSTLARGNTYTAILSFPTTIQYINITEENFWRCVSSFGFRNIYQASWSETRKWLSAPDTSIEGYETWLANALVFMCCELKSMQSSIRGLQWCGESLDVSNKLFFISEDEFKSYCNDDLILEDYNTFGFKNQFFMGKLEQSKELWLPEVKELFEFCKMAVLSTYDVRKNSRYKGSLVACDAGLAQLRYGLFTQEANQKLFDYLGKARTVLGKDLSKFGYMCETEE